MDLCHQVLEAGDNVTKLESWSHMGTSSSQNNCTGLKCNVNQPLEGDVEGMSLEETMSSVLQILAQDDQLQHLQGTDRHERGLLHNSDDLAVQKQPVMSHDQNPERSHLQVEKGGKKRWTERDEGEMEEDVKGKLEKEQEKEEEEKEEENEEQNPRKRIVGKPLMHTLWATFKLVKNPTTALTASLAFQFSMTEKQIKQWFRKKRNKYKKEIHKHTFKKRHKRC